MRRPAQPQVHADARAPRAAGSHRGEDRPRLRLRGRAEPGRRHQRRQARGVQRVPDPARPGRRGDAARAVLDHLSRGGEAGRRRSRRGASRREVGGFRVTVEQLEAARTPRTKALRVRVAEQPDRRGVPRAEVEAIGRWAAGHGIWVVTDEIYEHLTYGDHEFSSMPVVVPELAEHVRRAQRRRQDLRDDGLARRLDDRSRRLHRGRGQPAVAPDVERGQRQPARRARRGVGRPRRRSPRCARRSTDAAA